MNDASSDARNATPPAMSPGVPEAPERRALPAVLVARVVDDLPRARRGDRARHDRVHADVVGRELDGALAREGRDGTLDRRVHAGGREAVQRGGRGHVDDDAAALRAHLRQRRLRRPEARLQPDGEHPVDRLLVDLLDVLVADPHRAVDDDVDPVERAECLVHRRAVRHVEREIRARRAVDADDLHAVGRQALGDRRRRSRARRRSRPRRAWMRRSATHPPRRRSLRPSPQRPAQL